MKLFRLLGCAIIVKLLVLKIFWHAPLYTVDEGHYVLLASNLLSFKTFALTYGPTALRPPLYPFFLSAIFECCGNGAINVVRFVQVFISVGSGWVLYLLSKSLFKEERIALVAVTIFLFYPTIFLFSYLLLSETLFIFLFLLGVYFFVMPNPRSYIFALSGFFFGLCSLTRSIGLPLGLGLGCLLFFFRRDLDRSFKIKLFYSSIFLGVMLLTISPWSIRNYKLFHAVVPIDTMGGLNLYMGNYAYTPLHRAWDAVENPRRIAWYRGHEEELSSMNEAAKQKWAIRAARRYMYQHPLKTLERSVIKFANLWQIDRNIIALMLKGKFPLSSFWVTKFILPLIIAISYVFLCIGGFTMLVFRLLRREAGLDMVVLYIFLVLSLIHSIVFGHSRYHMPFVPFLAMYTAFLVVRYREIKTYPAFRSSFIGVMCLFLPLWGYDVFIGSRDKLLMFIGKILS